MVFNGTKMHITNNFQLKQLGFTLIEILLVIAILAVLAGLSISTYQKHASSAKVNVAALEIQGILQSASAYYTANNAWPAANIGLTKEIPADFILYLAANPQNGQLVNPWGYHYYIDGTNLDPHTGQTKYKFLVETHVPTQVMAQQLANSLPFAQAGIANDPNIVIAYMPLPGQQQQLLGNYLIKTIGNTEEQADGATITFPTFSCPPNWTPGVDAVINSINASSSDSLERFCTKIDNHMIDLIQISTTQCNAGSNGYSCTAKLTAKSKVNRSICWNFKDTNFGKVAFSYIAYCKNPNPS